jgi:hypothetical protein
MADPNSNPPPGPGDDDLTIDLTTTDAPEASQEPPVAEAPINGAPAAGAPVAGTPAVGAPVAGAPVPSTPVTGVAPGAATGSGGTVLTVSNVEPRLILKPYLADKQRDYVRLIVTVGLLLMLGWVIVWSCIESASWSNHWAQTKEMLQTILPALTGLIGSVIGFYFGSGVNSTSSSNVGGTTPK